MMCDDRLWKNQIRALRRRCVTTSVADLFGEATIETLAERVLAAASPRFALAGLSMGGIPDADLVVLSRSGHLSPLERPDAVTHEFTRLLARRPAEDQLS